MTAQFSQGHALVIGVSEYTHIAHWRVPQTAADAQAVANVLQDPQYCGYPAAQVQVLAGAAATTAAIRDGLRTLQQTQPADTVFIFYSGHGHTSDDKTYFLTGSDTQLNERGNVAPDTGISAGELATLLKGVQAERVLLIFNACHAGNIGVLGGDNDAAPPATLGQAVPLPVARGLLGTGSGRFVMTACRPKQFSFVGTGKHTLFGDVLLRGLQGDDLMPRNGYVSAFDLYTFIHDEVKRTVERTIPAATRQQYGGTQEPMLTVTEAVGAFAVALYQGAQGGTDGRTLGGTVAGDAVETVNPERSLRNFAALQEQWQGQQQQQQQTAGGDAYQSQGDMTVDNSQQSGGVRMGDVHGNVEGGIGNTTNIDGDQFNIGKVGNLIDRPSGNVDIRGNNYGPAVGTMSGGEINYDYRDNSVRTGNVSGSGIAIGAGASAQQQTNYGGGQPNVQHHFVTVYATINAGNYSQRKQDYLTDTIRQLEQQVAQRAQLPDIQRTLADIDDPTVAQAARAALAAAGFTL